MKFLKFQCFACIILMVGTYPAPGKRLADKLAAMSAKGDLYFMTFVDKYVYQKNYLFTMLFFFKKFSYFVTFALKVKQSIC